MADIPFKAWLAAQDLYGDEAEAAELEAPEVHADGGAGPAGHDDAIGDAQLFAIEIDEPHPDQLHEEQHEPHDELEGSLSACPSASNDVHQQVAYR